MPGHTEGSGAYLAQGILFLGDAGQITSKAQLTGPNKLFSTDAAQGAACSSTWRRKSRRVATM